MKNILYTIVLSLLLISCSDDKKVIAYKETKALAEQGDAEAQHTLGRMYVNGEGVTQDDKEAVRWWRLAAEQGNANSQTSLGVSYKNGEGVTQDDKEAVRWWRLAAEQGHLIGQAALCIMYDKGEGVKQDYVIAYMWCNVSDTTSGIDLSDLDTRTKLVKKMTSEQIAKAQELARECIKKNYKDCG
mgnify:CR=1 FL=1